MSLFDNIRDGASAAEFAVFGDVCRYLPQAGEAFDLRYVKHDPAIDQVDVHGVYYADLEVRLADFLVPPRRKDEVDIDGVRYVVAKVITPPRANAVVALHRKADA